MGIPIEGDTSVGVSPLVVTSVTMVTGGGRMGIPVSLQTEGAGPNDEPSSDVEVVRSTIVSTIYVTLPSPRPYSRKCATQLTESITVDSRRVNNLDQPIVITNTSAVRELSFDTHQCCPFNPGSRSSGCSSQSRHWRNCRYSYWRDWCSHNNCNPSLAIAAQTACTVSTVSHVSSPG